MQQQRTFISIKNGDPKAAVIAPCSAIYGAQQDGPGAVPNEDLKIEKSLRFTLPLPVKLASGPAVPNADLNRLKSLRFTVRSPFKSASQILP